MDIVQGASVPEPSAPVEGGQAPASATTVSPDLSQFIETPSAVPSATPVAQGGEQGASQAVPDATHFQRIADQRQAEIYRLQQDNQRLLQQQIEALNQRQQPQGNPYDPNVDFARWNQYEIQQATRQAAQEARQAAREENQNLMQQMAEMSWAQQHPGVDVQSIKMFNQQNGIAPWNLDAGYRLMTYGQTMGSVAQAAQQNVVQQFRQPQTGAVPIRSQGAPPPVQGQLSFEKLAQEIRRNPDFYEQLPPHVQKQFDAELALRQKMFG